MFDIYAEATKKADKLRAEEECHREADRKALYGLKGSVRPHIEALDKCKCLESKGVFKREALSYLNAKIQITLAALQDTRWGYTWADTHRRQGKVAAAVELKRRILALNVPLTKGRCFRLCECALNRYYKERNARGGAHKDRDRAQKETGYFDALREIQHYLEVYG
jgi:hypothetical protein